MPLVPLNVPPPPQLTTIISRSTPIQWSTWRSLRRWGTRAIWSKTAGKNRNVAYSGKEPRGCLSVAAGPVVLTLSLAVAGAPATVTGESTTQLIPTPVGAEQLRETAESNSFLGLTVS